MTPRTILLVHPATDVRRIYRAALEHAGYAVLDTWDADDALVMLSTKSCDAVVADLFVESVGPEKCFVKRVRADERTKQMPVLVVTAWSTDRYRDYAAESGATEFLSLPVLPREIVGAVRRHCGPAAREMAS